MLREILLVVKGPFGPFFIKIGGWRGGRYF